MAEQKAEQKERVPEAPKAEVIILKDKQARIILSLKSKEQEWYLSSLAKATGTTYVHACKFINACEGKGLTESERHGRIKAIKLTERGVQLAELVSGIYGIMNQPQKEAEAKERKEAEKEKKEDKENKDKEKEKDKDK